MPDCKDTSALVPLYNEIQATTTFAGSALFFLFTQFAGASPAVARGARGRIEESWANASDTCRDGGFLGATQHHRRDMQHHFGTQLKELIPSQHRGRVRLVLPRSAQTAMPKRQRRRLRPARKGVRQVPL